MTEIEDDEERKAIVEAMISATMPPLREPGDFTLEEFVERLAASGYQITSKRIIRDRLNNEVAAGRLSKLTVWDNLLMRTVRVYRPVDPDPEQQNEGG